MDLEKCDREKAVSLLKAVLANQLSAEAALAEWPTVSKTSSKAMKTVYHQLYHYLTDEDIRTREPEYAQYQQAGLQRCLDDLVAETTNVGVESQ